MFPAFFNCLKSVTVSLSQSSHLALALTISFFATHAKAEPLIGEPVGGKTLIQAEQYHAVVDKNGCMTELIIGDVSFIQSGVAKFTRGIYLFADKKVIRMNTITRVDESSLLASGSQAALRYQFTQDQISYSVENKSQSKIKLFFVIHKKVERIVLENGEGVAPPVGNAGQLDVRFEAGENALQLAGKARLWPFQGHQVAEYTVDPGHSLTINASIKGASMARKPLVSASPELVKKTMPEIQESIVKPEATGGVEIVLPVDYQVIQRNSSNEGNIPLQVVVPENTERLEYRLTGESIAGALTGNWVELKLPAAGEDLKTELLTKAGGWYQLELRASGNGSTIGSALIPRVGVGEVFIGAGQSNSTSCGEFRTNPVSGMVSNFTGNSWRVAKDPQLGSADQKKKGCDGGSYYPAFGDALYEKYKVPIGVSPTGHTGTSVKYWQPGGNLYKRLRKRMETLGQNGFRAVLWHQGETDIDLKLTEDEYFSLLKKVIDMSRQHAGWDVPWVVAHVSYPRLPEQNAIRNAQQKLWQKDIALQGPDTDKLGGDHRDRTGVHFSPKGLKKHGQLWAEKVAPLLEATRSNL